MVVVKQRMERIGTDTLHFYVTWYSPLALPLGELSPKVTERVLHLGFPLSVFASLSHLSHRERQGVQSIIPLCLLTV